MHLFSFLKEPCPVKYWIDSKRIWKQWMLVLDGILAFFFKQRLVYLELSLQLASYCLNFLLLVLLLVSNIQLKKNKKNVNAFSIALLYLYIGIVYVRASRELKKLNASSRSPILRLYSDTLNGLLTIRAYGEEWTMMKKMFNKLDDNMRPFYTLWTTNR